MELQIHEECLAQVLEDPTFNLSCELSVLHEMGLQLLAGRNGYCSIMPKVRRVLHSFWIDDLSFRLLQFARSSSVQVLEELMDIYARFNAVKWWSWMEERCPRTLCHGRSIFLPRSARLFLGRDNCSTHVRISQWAVAFVVGPLSRRTAFLVCPSIGDRHH